MDTKNIKITINLVTIYKLIKKLIQRKKENAEIKNSKTV